MSKPVRGSVVDDAGSATAVVDVLDKVVVLVVVAADTEEPAVDDVVEELAGDEVVVGEEVVVGADVVVGGGEVCVVLVAVPEPDEELVEPPPSGSMYC